MSGGQYIKQAIIAVLCEHPDQEKYKARAFSGDNFKKMMDANHLTKADFFTPDDDGKYLIDTPGFWKNFDAIREIVEKSGERFEAEDFTRSLRDDTRNLLNSAAQYSGLGKIFSFDVWKGRFDEMERLWYKVPAFQRTALFNNDGLIDLGLKRRVLASEGRSAPEDRLAKAGLTLADIRSACQERGNYEDVQRRLSLAGDYLRKEYLMIPDKDGDSFFFHPGTWARYDNIVKTMQNHGERFEVSDFVRQVGTRANILRRAAEKNMVKEIFNPDHWVGRLQDMTTLWSYVLPAWQTASMPPQAFDDAYATAEDKTYAAKANFTAFTSKQALLTPLNGDSGAKPVLPIGLKSFWGNYDTIEKALSSREEKITLQDLRSVSGEMGNSCLLLAAKCGKFEEVLRIAQKSGEAIMLDDFLSRDRHGASLLDILSENRSLGTVFMPEIWVGRVGEMKALWNHVRVSNRSQVDIEQVEVAVKQATLQAQSRSRFKLPRKPGGPK